MSLKRQKAKGKSLGQEVLDEFCLAQQLVVQNGDEFKRSGFQIFEPEEFCSLDEEEEG